MKKVVVFLLCVFVSVGLLEAAERKKGTKRTAERDVQDQASVFICASCEKEASGLPAEQLCGHLFCQSCSQAASSSCKQEHDDASCKMRRTMHTDAKEAAPFYGGAGAAAGAGITTDDDYEQYLGDWHKSVDDYYAKLEALRVAGTRVSLTGAAAAGGPLVLLPEGVWETMLQYLTGNDRTALRLTGKCIPEVSLSLVVHALSTYSITRIKKAAATFKKLTIEHSERDFNFTQLRAALLAAPHLEELNFGKYAKASAGFLELPAGSLPKLKTLNLNDNFIAAAQLHFVLAAAPHLEELDLPGGLRVRAEDGEDNVAAGFLGLPAGSLSKLKKLNLAERNITADQLRAALLAAPHLEKLDLEECRGVSAGFLGLPQGSLSKLKKLYFARADILPAELAVVLAAARDLEKINLDGCEAAAGFLGLPAGSLSKLKKLYLGGDNITVEQLQAALSAAPHLEKLYLEAGDETAAIFLELPEGSLSSLKILRFDNQLSDDLDTDIRSRHHIDITYIYYH